MRNHLTGLSKFLSGEGGAKMLSGIFYGYLAVFHLYLGRSLDWRFWYRAYALTRILHYVVNYFVAFI